MRLKQAASRHRRVGRPDRVAPQVGSTGVRRSRWLALACLILLAATLTLWRSGIGRSRVTLPPLPRNLTEQDADVARLIQAKYQRVQDDPDDPAAWGDLAMVYEANQLWNDARAAYAQAVARQPDNRLWRLHLAIAAQEVGDFAAALAELRTLAAAHPDFAPAQQRLADALLETGEWDAARTAYERVLQTQPKAAEGYVGLASVALRQGNPAEAVRLLQQALSLDRQYPVAHHLLGTAYTQLGREQEAAAHLALGMDATVRYLPDSLAPRLAVYAVNVKALVSRGGRQLADGQTQRAIRTLEHVLQAEPENVSAMNNLAVAYARQQRFDDAHRVLQRALQIDPHKYLTYINLANWASLTGDVPQALEFADKAVELAPQVDIPHRTRAILLVQLNRLDDALANASQAAALNPSDARTQSLCADLCVRLGRSAEAAESFRRLTELTPNNVEAWVGLCQSSLANNDLATATRALGHASRLAPDSQRVRQTAEQLRARQAGTF
jgi:Flp pilus assembly protein TadD